MHSSSKSPEVVEPTVDRSIYSHVVEVGFVVQDLDRIINHWEQLGLKNIRRMGTQDVPGITYLGKKSPLTLKIAQGEIGGVRVRWIQPVRGTSDFDRFLERHGDGVHHLAYAVRNEEGLEKQLRNFRSKGVGVVMEADWKGDLGERRSVYLDTAERGAGITFALKCDPDTRKSGIPKTGNNEEPFNKFAQYAIVTRDLKKTGAFYENLGFGSTPIDCVDYSSAPERYYRGKLGKFTISTNQWGWGTVPYEWIQPGVGPSVFDECLKNHGEGIQHLAFIVTVMDQTLAAMAAKGVEVAQSGGFSYQNRRGRFAYVDTEPYGGIMIEFIWREPHSR
jgi:methylmalonyl-CoA/ethylmalonyl-CoA epimerase